MGIRERKEGENEPRSPQEREREREAKMRGPVRLQHYCWEQGMAGEGS